MPGLRSGAEPSRRDHEVARDVPTAAAGMRLDRFVASLPGIGTRSQAKQLIDAGRVRVDGIPRPDEALRVDPGVLCRLPDAARRDQQVFDRTGGLHAAALFDATGALLTTREDIGRHNAVDKIVGFALLQGRLPLSAHILFVSGRGAFEIVQKALVAGIPVVASVSAPSSLAVELAREHGLTLVGFLRGQRFVVYSGDERVVSLSAAKNA